eukprot:5214167-Pyramimonas_sp.AAC.1
MGVNCRFGTGGPVKQSDVIFPAPPPQRQIQPRIDGPQQSISSAARRKTYNLENWWEDRSGGSVQFAGAERARRGRRRAAGSKRERDPREGAHRAVGAALAH